MSNVNLSEEAEFMSGPLTTVYVRQGIERTRRPSVRASSWAASIPIPVVEDLMVSQMTSVDRGDRAPDKSNIGMMWAESRTQKRFEGRGGGGPSMTA